MSKAITGAIEIGAGIALAAGALFYDPALLANSEFDELWVGLIAGGIAMEAAALADSLTANRGENITTRQPASFRQIIYGTQRVGGVEIWRSTTGSSHDQFNYVIVLAGHELSAIQNLYLDGRQVYWQNGSAGQSTRGGYTFGGFSDGNDHIGPDGTTYNFGDAGHGALVYCEARYGDQADGDVIGGLTANDPAWAASNGKSPWVGGCAYVYLKIEYDTSEFPQEPEIRFTVQGKPVYDPRTGATGYSHNPALIINDICNDSVFGLNDPTVNQDQLIAAANICEEQIMVAATSTTEDRYACHWHYDASTEPGDAISMALDSMAGRMSRVGGEYFLFPGVWSAPVLNLGADQLRGPVSWNPKRAGRSLFNRVTGTYTAANYPYNTAGNLYDSNGWYNGTIQNNFPFAFQPSNYPMYACDVLHGYAADEYLAQDGGTPLNKEQGFPQVLSITQAQRLAKIALLRNRQQGSGSFEVGIEAYQLVPCDTFNMSFAQMGWQDTVLEVNSVNFSLSSDSGGAPQISLKLGVNEADPSVYEWSTTEELSPYDVPVAIRSATSKPSPPTNVELISSAATALLQADGSVVPRIEVTWDTPLDIYVTQIQVQYRPSGTTAWITAASVDVAQNSAYISPVIAGQNYDVEIRSQRSNGVGSAWVEIDNFTVSLVLSVQMQEGVGIGSLTAEAYTDGTAAIICNPFDALVGMNELPIFPSGSVTISGLLQQTTYWLYYDDPTYAGGDVTPVATTNKNDVLGVIGRFLIDAIVTPYCGTTGTGPQYRPTAYSDNGTSTTQSPQYAYDGDTTTSAVISGGQGAVYIPGFGSDPSETDTTYAAGDCVWSGFPAITTSAALTLYVVAAATSTVTGGASAGSSAITASIGGTTSALTASGGTFSVAVPAGTNLGTVSVEVTATPGDVGAVNSSQRSSVSSIKISITEIYISQ